MDWNQVDISNIESLNFEESFSLAKYISQKDVVTEEIANKIIIKVLDIWENVDDSTKDLWVDLIESAGFYPYLLRIIEANNQLDTTSEIRSAYHSSKKLENITFHKEQKILANLIAEEKNLIVSAPTSFGKSLLIQEIISLNKYKNILIIQPTLALINETRVSLRKFSNNYNIIVNTSQEMESKNIFILTAERVLEYEGLPKIDYCILDEFYKLSSFRDDERSDVLNIALRKVLKSDPIFYFIGPNIDNIPEGFKERYNAIFFKTQYSLVNTEIVKVDLEYQTTGVRRQAKEKEQKLFELLYTQRHEQSIVYVSSPQRAYNLAVKYYDYLNENGLVKEEQCLPVSEWIQENLSEDWGFNNLIKNYIGVHSGIIPKHLVHSMIEYFNEGKLDVLFCTSTIIEGVNTSAKNVFIFDNKKGPNLLDFFDFSNIKGRAGRMLKHYTGKVYIFNSVPQREDINLDIPYHDQKYINDEILVNLDRDEVHTSHLERYDELHDYNEELLKVIKKNAVSVAGQKEIIKQLRQKLKSNPELIMWDKFPNKYQLNFLISLSWNYLLKPTETTRPMTINKLPVTIRKHISNSLYVLIMEEQKYLKQQNPKWTEKRVIDTAIENVFREKRHWISYKVPKWLNVVNLLQKVLCKNEGLATSGDYSFFASYLENEGVEERFSLLIDMGIPSSVINKIDHLIPDDLKGQELIYFVKNLKRDDVSSLMAYEIDKIGQL
ncbi:DEAD/DEAH box helicase [Bacillus thuringiensis]|uniref:DEAD/DEAH box helicase n=1 Tax=Bacillus thuringiensis TaxID=1428 RepID=UPI000BF31336|nr:DEAD/DEAH box helicase [Bacillus thuringiensis]PFE66847.1 DEAD/DEAH box helicase [Bacillus thuringiensis]PFI29467.1 DEAD/DEAH box helicase [Bacillus thuringiensis]PFL36391.1 DEAD/DEAH box helicase [Bacillus thuringiensis]PFW20005.1 DEAD/DEAH box helicase [Bacillus thuringiensis]PGQ22781.1 DEAD/DEAH box helicase [Bacillus thuringiensis]